MSEELNRGKRRRWLRWTGYLALAGLGLIALGLAMSLWSQAKGKRLLAAEVARIKAEGIELDWRKLKPPTEEDETAKLVIEVGDRLRTTNLRRGFPPAAPMIGPGIFLPMIDRSGWEFMNFSKGQMTTNHASWDTFEAAIAPHMDDLNEVSEALAIAPPAFALDRSSYPESRTRHDGAALELTSWLRADGLRHLRAGRAVQAHGSLLALLNLSEGTAGTKTPFSVIVATTVQNQAWGLLLECVGKVNWTPEQWRQTQNGFDLVDWTGTGRQVLELETAAGWHLFERIRADVSVATNLVTFSTPNWWDSARDSALDHVGSAAPGFGEWVGHRIEAGELWWTERVCTSFWRNHWLSEDAIAFLQRSHLAHRSLRQLPDDAALTRFARTNDWDNWMAAYDGAAEARPHVFQVSAMLGGLSAGQKFLYHYFVAQHRGRLAATVCAIQRHVLVNGAPPSDLAALVPDFMSAVPIDPGDGQPLRYRLNTDGTWQLYSTALDGIDDVGDGNSVRGRSFYTSTAKDILWPRPATPEEVVAYEQGRPGQTAFGDGE